MSSTSSMLSPQGLNTKCHHPVTGGPYSLEQNDKGLKKQSTASTRKQFDMDLKASVPEIFRASRD